MIFAELKTWWRLLCRILVLVGVLLSFFAVIELLRAYLTLRNLHPLAGYAYLAALAALLIWACYYLWAIFRTHPRTLALPPTDRPRKYARYLARYLRRLQLNAALSNEQKTSAQNGHQQLTALLKASPAPDALEAQIRTVEKDTLAPLIKSLDQIADRRIAAAVRDIMFAVTVSPYRSIDLLVVLYRNLAMIRNIAAAYNSRPPLREALQILYDVARVVATVNFLNLGSKMIENVSKGLPSVIPGVSKIVDDCAEGLAAGLLTSVTGHAAKDRCRAFRGWDYEQARQNIASHLKVFTADVGRMFFQDITPHIRLPGGLTAEKWRNLRDSIAHGFNETVDAIGHFVRWPVDAARRREREQTTESTEPPPPTTDTTA